MANTELFYLQHCKKLIEEELKWVNSQKWKQRDYLYLIDLIENRTGISLSLSTIKRIWQKEVSSIPQPATLDALAIFLGYDNWMHFKESNQDEVSNEPVKSRNWLPVRTLVITLGVILVSVPVFILIQKIGTMPAKGHLIYDPDEIDFACTYSASSGVPNTVIFHYDVNKVEADSFFIQQSWDEHQREHIQKTEKNLTSIYYFPGYHKAKLIANDSIIKQTDVQVYTDDWLAMVRDGYMDNFPVYIRNSDLAQNGELHVTKEHLNANQIDLNENTLVSYYYVADFESPSSSNFGFKTKVRCDSIFNFTCPHVAICILGEEDMNFIPFTIKGCVGYVNVKMGDVTKSGKNTDLSAFGVDVYSWQEIEVRTINNVATILLNGEQLLELPFDKNIGNIVGFNINFSGSGAIDYIRLADTDGEKVYYTEFGSSERR